MMSPEEKSHIGALTNTMTTRCIGRFLIDLPKQMLLRTEGGQEINDVTLSLVPMSEREFKNLMEAKRADYSERILPGPEKFPFLDSATTFSAGTKGILFDRAESDAGMSRMGRVLELMEWKSGYAIFASIKATDTDFPEFANDAWIKESKTTTREKREQLLELVARTRGRGEDEVPTERGLCILNGFVAGAATAAESVTLSFQLRGASDVFLTVSSDSSHARSDTLTERGQKVQPIVEQAQGRILRMGKRLVSDVNDGEEFLYKMLGDPNSERRQIMTYKFAFEANNAVGSTNTPLVAIDLDNGDVRPTSKHESAKANLVPIGAATLTEAEAIAVWDAVIPTFRRRSGAF